MLAGELRSRIRLAIRANGVSQIDNSLTQGFVRIHERFAHFDNSLGCLLEVGDCAIGIKASMRVDQCTSGVM
jgi:hypothetical protein